MSGWRVKGGGVTRVKGDKKGRDKGGWGKELSMYTLLSMLRGGGLTSTM